MEADVNVSNGHERPFGRSGLRRYAARGGPVGPIREEPDFLLEAARRLPETLDAGAWSAWTDALKAATGRKGKALFLPLRKALTGLDHGPEMAALLPLIGRDAVLGRLEGRA